ncbi:heterokaryon incompatibility protein-domain-containing protein [Diaporthe sp. PMI_573]|nr:heterokaryon incompatibility protein-domain-containing protein [Diaporthaceae sp. PMI_573]
MAPTIDTETFRYQKLPTASTYIRLLEVISVDQRRDVPVHCELTTWPKASAPAYTAVSYAWGDPRRLTVILVNGKRMEVRCNCEDVLRQPCWNRGGYFWIDAICINQADNHEKSFQVAKMGEIYGAARQTIACVGRHEDDSEFLFDRLHRHQRRWERISNSFNGMGNFQDRPWLILY